MMHLILADAELELVPQSIQGHPAVVKNAKSRKKKPSNILLDANYHHQAIRSRFGKEAERRGRPDIVHFFLMNAQESILNKMGELRVYVHTRNNQVIYIAPETRLPKSYPRFVGLMESLFHNGAVPSMKAPLMRIEEMSLKVLVKSIGHRTVLLSESGRLVNIKDQPLSKDITVIVGGFSSGDFLSDVSFADETIAISSDTLMAWVAAYEIITAYENQHIR